MLTRDIAELREVQSEIRIMNQSLVTLANELKHTNAHLLRHEQELKELSNQPRVRLQQIVTAFISAAAGAVISLCIRTLAG